MVALVMMLRSLQVRGQRTKTAITSRREITKLNSRKRVKISATKGEMMEQKEHLEISKLSRLTSRRSSSKSFTRTKQESPNLTEDKSKKFQT
jgi:hypothetical protein